MSLCECLKQLREDCHNAKFLILDVEKSKEEIVRLLVMGAHGYVAHADVSRTLIRSIFCVVANQLWVAPEVLQEFLSRVGHALRRDGRTGEVITSREEEILELVRRRLSNKEIAQVLQIRLSTVKFHLSNILAKLHANNRRELTGVLPQTLWETLSQ